MPKTRIVLPLHARIDHLEALVESCKDALMAHLTRRDKTLARIEFQTTKTNVGVLEAQAIIRFHAPQLFDPNVSLHPQFTPIHDGTAAHG